MANPKYFAGVTMNLGLGNAARNIEVRRIDRASNMPYIAPQCGDEWPLLSQLALAVDRRPDGMRDAHGRRCVRDVSSSGTVVVTWLKRTSKEERRSNKKWSARLHLTRHKISCREPSVHGPQHTLPTADPRSGNRQACSRSAASPG